MYTDQLFGTDRDIYLRIYFLRRDIDVCFYYEVKKYFVNNRFNACIITVFFTKFPEIEKREISYACVFV